MGSAAGEASLRLGPLHTWVWTTWACKCRSSRTIRTSSQAPALDLAPAPSACSTRSSSLSWSRRELPPALHTLDARLTAGLGRGRVHLGLMVMGPEEATLEQPWWVPSEERPSAAAPHSELGLVDTQLAARVIHTHPGETADRPGPRSPWEIILWPLLRAKHLLKHSPHG